MGLTEAPNRMIAVIQATSHRFGGFDLAIVVFCALLLLGTGLFFARRQKNAEVYFVAGRNRSPLLAGVSLFAALFTIIAYIGIPGEVVQHGPVLSLDRWQPCPSATLSSAAISSPHSCGCRLQVATSCSKPGWGDPCA